MRRAIMCGFALMLTVQPVAVVLYLARGEVAKAAVLGGGFLAGLVAAVMYAAKPEGGSR